MKFSVIGASLVILIAKETMGIARGGPEREDYLSKKLKERSTEEVEEGQQVFLYTTTANFRKHHTRMPLRWKDVDFDELKDRVDSLELKGKTTEYVLMESLNKIFGKLANEIEIFEFPIPAINENNVKCLASLTDLSAEEVAVVTKLNKYVKDLSEKRDLFCTFFLSSDFFCIREFHSVLDLFEKWDRIISGESSEERRVKSFEKKFKDYYDEHSVEGYKTEERLHNFERNIKTHLTDSSQIDALMQSIIDKENSKAEKKTKTETENKMQNEKKLRSENKMQNEKKSAKEKVFEKLHITSKKTEPKKPKNPSELNEQKEKKRSDLFKEINDKIEKISQPVNSEIESYIKELRGPARRWIGTILSMCLTIKNSIPKHNQVKHKEVDETSEN